MAWHHRLRSFWRTDRLDRDLADELRFHIDMRTRDNISSGMPPDQARREAHLRFGNTTLVKERTRDMNILGWLETATQDLHYAARMLRKNPGFAAVATVALALGIGANSAMFSVVYAVMLKPLPYARPERLLWLTMHLPGMNADLAGAPQYFQWRDQTQIFDDVAAYDYGSFVLAAASHGDESEQVQGAMVTWNLLRTLGVQPVLGRGVSEEEDQPGGPNSVILTHSLFERRFHGDTSVVGKTIHLDDQIYTIAGVLGPDFRFPENIDIDLLVPLALAKASGPGIPIVNVIARAKAGVTVERARSDLTVALKRSSHLDPSRVQMKVVALDRQLLGDHRATLLVLLGAVSLVLLIACGNVANLLLGRAAARQREIAVRAALGAARSRLIRQFLTESLLLSLGGAAMGLVLARFAIHALVSLGGSRVPFIEQTSIGPHVLGFTIIVATLTGIVFGTAPSLAAASVGVMETLKRSGISTTPSTSHRRFRGLLVISEIALALVLLVGAGLAIKSLWILETRDPGFQPERILTADMTANHSKYASIPRRLAFFKDVIEKIANVPGVSASAASLGSYFRGGFQVDGRPASKPGSAPLVFYDPVSPDFFRAMGIRVKRGRIPNDREPRCSLTINESVARVFLPTEDPVGVAIALVPDGKPCTVAGVVSNSSDRGLDVDVPPIVYVPVSQVTLPPFALHLVVRATGDPLAFASMVREQIRAVDPDQPIFNVRSMEQKLAESIAPRRFSMILLSVFAGLALALAMVGIYAVMFASVSERAHEVGIRMALGAERGDVLKLILGQGVRLVIAGLIFGIAGSWGATRLLKTTLYGVSTIDPWIFAFVPLLLMVVAITASLIPAIRATRVDPVVALRQE